MKHSQLITQKLEILPDKPGVYLMKNSRKTVIYVGKAKNLKNRVRSYFRSNLPDAKTENLVENIVDFDYIITNTEREALILENNLIKKYKPHYNILLKDDKEYPFIKITSNEAFPRIIVTRQPKKDGSYYFGPYTDVHSLRKVLRLLEWVFPHRTCDRKIPKDEVIFKKACINYQMDKCTAPCVGKISYNDYKKTITNIKKFLHGKNSEIIKQLKDDMNVLADKLLFEEAALIRDKIQDIQKLNNSRHLFFTDEKNRDVISLYKEENLAAVTVLKILSGKLQNKETYPMQNVKGKPKSEIMKAFLMQYYQEKIENLPSQIILHYPPFDFDEINEILKNKLFIPQRGELRALVMIANKNAFNFVEEQKMKYLKKKNRTIFSVIELKEKLNLKKLPRKMICIDISTIQGTDTVSSLVYFENGKPKKKNYRHFIIKTVEGQNDFASVAETLNRYIAKLDKETTPELIVIDGGKGQLSAAYNILIESKIKEVEMISLAKRLEEVFVAGQKSSIILPKNSSALRLLVAIRDESHRFAITFHKKRRSQRTLTSQMDKIKGIGEKTKFLLLKEFGSVENIKNKTIEEIIKVKGVGIKTAKILLRDLNEE